MDEEKLRILKMVEDCKVSATDAVKLIEALEKTESRPSERELRKRWLHVRVDKDGDRNVDVKIPLSLLKFGFKLAPHIGGGKHHRRAARDAERSRHRAERTRAKAEMLRQKFESKGERMRARFEAKFGTDTNVDIESVVNEALEDALEEVEEAMEEAQEAMEEAQEMARESASRMSGASAGGVPGIPELGNLDLDKILEMAAREDFDGKILEIHDDDDDEHVVITLE